MGMRLLAWGAVLVGSASLGGSIWWFVEVGLDDANKLAGVGSFVLAALALGVTVWGIVASRQPGTLRQSVTDSTIGGGVLQVQKVRGRVVVRRGLGNPLSPPTSSGPVPTPTDSHTTTPYGGQSVSHNRVAGPVDQIREAGELEVDR